MKTISILTIAFFFFSVPLWAVDLTKATLQELVNQRPDFVQDIKAGKDEGTTTVSIVKDAKGRVKTWVEERKNLDNIAVGKRVDKYTYYSTGEINGIFQERYEGTNLILVSKRKIKHYRDGTQPDVTLISVEIPIGP